MKKGSRLRKLEGKCDVVCPLLKALSHPGRLLVMGCLLEGEKTVSELQERCGLSQSLLSQFLGRMRLEGLVRSEKKGRYQFYAAADERVARLVHAIQSLYCS